jgi:uncharacterized membrane protein
VGVSRQNLSPARLEAFSDGVIAVIITIMVLELKVPAMDGMDGLRGVLPTVILYLLSFIQVGIYWVNHHYLIDEAKAVSHGMLWANLIFLFCLSLFPFATNWVGMKGLSPFSTALYAGVCLLPGVSFMALWLAVRAQSSVAPHATWSKMNTSTALYLLAIPVAFYRPMLALGLIGTVAVMWLLPPKVEEGAQDSAERSSSGEASNRKTR